MSRQGRLPQEFALVGVARTQMSGALRDLIQNHLLQVMCVIAMEPPSTFDAESVRIANRDIRCSRVHCRQLALAGRAVLCAHGQTHGATHKFSDTALQAAATLDLRRPTTASEHSDDLNPAGGRDLPRLQWQTTRTRCPSGYSGHGLLLHRSFWRPQFCGVRTTDPQLSRRRRNIVRIQRLDREILGIADADHGSMERDLRCTGAVLCSGDVGAC